MSQTTLQKIKRLLPPSYAWIPLGTVVAVNFLVYNGVRLINSGRAHTILSIPLDEKVPFLTPFVLVYVLAFVQWVVGYDLAACSGKDVCYRIAAGDIIAKLITCGIFVALPTTLNRPEVTGSALLDQLTRFIFWVDAPDNLFPSIHCLESWMCFRASLMMKHAPRWYRVGSFVFTLLVFASTVCLKQHLLLDIPGGVAVAELGLALSRVLPVDALFDRLNRRAPWA